MDDVFIHKAAHHMHDGVHLADMAEELVAQALALARALDQTGNIHKLDGGGGHLLRVIHIRQHVQAGIRHQHHAGIGLDGAEGIVGGLRAGLGNGIEKGALAHVGQAHDSQLHSSNLLSRPLRAALLL